MLHFVQICNAVDNIVVDDLAAMLKCSVSSRQNLLQLGQHWFPHRRLVQRGTSQLPAGAGLPGRNRQQLRHLRHGSSRWSVPLHHSVSLQWRSLSTDSVLGLQVLCSSLMTRGWSSASTTTRRKTTPSTPWGGSPTWAEEPPPERPSDTALATSSSIFAFMCFPPEGALHAHAAVIFLKFPQSPIEICRCFCSVVWSWNTVIVKVIVSLLSPPDEWDRAATSWLWWRTANRMTMSDNQQYRRIRKVSVVLIKNIGLHLCGPPLNPVGDVAQRLWAILTHQCHTGATVFSTTPSMMRIWCSITPHGRQNKWPTFSLEICFF